MDDNDISYFVQSILSRSSRRCVNNTAKRDYFRGTCTSDDLIGNEQLKFNLRSDSKGNNNFLFCFVINTVSYDDVIYKNQVGHWLAIAIRFNKCHNILFLHFFDSFGKNYTDYKRVKSYINWVKSKCDLHQVKFTCDRLNKPIQEPFSKLCGLYACRAVAHVWEHSTNSSDLLKHSFSSIFGGNRKNNDLKMERYLYKEWPSKECHNRSFPWKILPIANLMKAPRPPGFCPKDTLGLSDCRMSKCRCL